MNTIPRAPADSPCESTDALLHESVSSLYDLDWEGILKAHPYIGDRIRRAMKRNETDAAPPVLSARPNEAEQRELPEAWGDCNILRCKSCGTYTTRIEAATRKFNLEGCGECNGNLQGVPNEADAPRGQAVDGWQLVPKEPTAGMVMAASEVTNRGESLFFADRYKAMLDAAPPPPSPVGEADGVREKYRLVGYVSMSTAEMLSTLPSNESSGYDVFAGTCIFRDRSNTEPIPIAIGAVVPNEVHVPQEGK